MTTPIMYFAEFLLNALIIYTVGWLIGRFAFRSLAPLPRASVAMGISFLLHRLAGGYFVYVGYYSYFHVHQSLSSILTLGLEGGFKNLPGALLAWWFYWRQLKRQQAKARARLEETFS